MYYKTILEKYRKLLTDRLNLFIALLVAFCAGMLVCVFSYFNLFEGFEMNTIDWRFKTLNQFMKKPDSKIIVIGVDDFSVAKVGRWPWKREQHGKIVDFLRIYGAEAVIFDLFFTYRDANYPESDIIFAKMAEKAGNVYAASRIMSVEEDYKQNLGLLNESKMQDNTIHKYFDVPAEHADKLIVPGKKLGYQLPYKELEQSLKKYGTVFTGELDYYNKIRYQNLVYELEGSYYPSMTMGFAKDFIVKQYEKNGQKRIKIPVDEHNQAIVNWHALKNLSEEGFIPPYKQYSAWRFIESYDNMVKASKTMGISVDKFKEILDKADYYDKNNLEYPDELIDYLEKMPEDFEFNFDGNNPVELFKDKIIIVGIASTSTTVRDSISTPFFRQIPGMFLQANTVDNLINQNFISKEHWGVKILLIFFLCIITALSIFCIKNSFAGIISCILINIAYFTASLVAFAKYNIWMDIIYTEIALILTFSVSSAVYYIIEGREKRKIKKAMSNYISPQIMEEVLSDPSKLTLGGTKRELTILFSDVRGFTTLSENADPQEVVKMLNEYFSAMVEVIFRNSGTVDKFIGDAIMAFWNAPLPVEEHPYLAVKTAVEMIEELEKLKQRWEKENKKGIDIGIGINTAEVTIGNIGSDKIKDYTIIGDGVNTASRLESSTKEYNAQIIISETTYQKVRGKILAEYLDECKLKGKDRLIKVYKVTGLAEK